MAESEPNLNSTIPTEYFNFLLERLIFLPLNTPEDAKRWDEACAALLSEFESKFPQFELEPHLRSLVLIPGNSSDIESRQQQHTAVYDYIVQLRRSVSPKGNNQKPSLIRVLVVVALPIASAFVAMPISQRIGGAENDWLGLGIIFRAGLIFLFGCLLAKGFWAATKESSD